MVKNGFQLRIARLILVLALLFSLGSNSAVIAQEEEPVILDPGLQVSTVVDGLDAPTTMAFLDENAMFVLQKNTGEVLHVMDGAVQGTVLDLAVNFASERGLLGIALDPGFAENGYVYLYWSCSAPAPSGDPSFPTEIECADEPQSGADTDDVLAAPLLGNRVDRFHWDGTNLTWDMNLVKLRSFQHDGAPLPRGQEDEDQPSRGNHDGGVISFGEDGKLYILIGDVGRRGWLQNLPFGPIQYAPEPHEQVDLSNILDEPRITPEMVGEFEDRQGVLITEVDRLSKLNPVPDDQFGGPMPDDAHYTGVILRLNTDGSIPDDNPFHSIGEIIGGEIGENIQKTYAYGIRNSFGMDIDPMTSDVWITENGEDAYDELNMVRRGFNSGWIQSMGPVADVTVYKEIETTSLHFEDFPNLQQFRWGPENIAESPAEALMRMFWLRGSHYSDPEFSWEFAIAPAAIGFVKSEALGKEYHGDLFMGLSVPLPLGGALFRFELTPDRQRINLENSGLDEPEAENEDFNSLIGSESFVIGANFGIVTDIETGPNGNLYVVSLSNGAVYEISSVEGAEPVSFTAQLTGAAEVPGPGDPDGTGQAHVMIDRQSQQVCFSIVVSNIMLPGTGAHIHVGEADESGGVVVPFVPPDELGASAGCTTGVDQALIDAILDDPAGYYVNVHTTDFPAGAIRGQLQQE